MKPGKEPNYSKVKLLKGMQLNMQPQPEIEIDDFSGMNSREVDRIFMPRTIADVGRIVKDAINRNKRVCMRGTKHSMGGQSISENAYVLDFSRLNSVEYDPKNSPNEVTVGPGATWSDIIRHLNRFGKAPKTMQSFSSFSVGGTLAVNAHGITTDKVVAESVQSFLLVEPKEGKLLKIDRNHELFGLVLGGYGMFGALVEVTLEIADNTKMNMEYLQIQSTRFPDLFDKIRKDKSVEMKITRMNVLDTSKVDLFVFRKGVKGAWGAGQKVVSKLPSSGPGTMSKFMQLMYKWVMPVMREQRYALEKATKHAIDWPADDEYDRNLMMYQSADDLGALYNPLLKFDDAFILQEFFVPATKFEEFMTSAGPTFQDVARSYGDVTLLNCTIRYVEKDNFTKLAYAGKDDMYAFVLYYRMPATPKADEILKGYHKRFVAATLALNGTFYLPYRQHYGIKDVTEAYPNFPEFVQKKRMYDPKGRFHSDWWQKYGADFEPQEEEEEEEEEEPIMLSNQVEEKGIKQQSYSSIDDHVDVSKLIDSASLGLERHGFYKKLVTNPHLREQFCEQFLTKIFNVEDKTTLMNHISLAVWETEVELPNEDSRKFDLAVYKRLLAKTGDAPEPSGVLSALGAVSKKMRALTQLNHQKREIARETVNLLNKMGKSRSSGQIQNYLSIGDPGKLVVPLRKALGLQKIWIVNDKLKEDLPSMIERGFVDVPSDIVSQYECPLLFAEEEAAEFKFPNELRDNAVDLVTMNQGLHHVHPKRLKAFLEEILRVLKPGGVLVIREHDLGKPVPSFAHAGDDELNAQEGGNGNARPQQRQPQQQELMPMLDLAHSVFNAVDGAPVEVEKSEIRAFRSVLDWRRILESIDIEEKEEDKSDDIIGCSENVVVDGSDVGPRTRRSKFYDSMLYEMEEGDPTWDEMLVFYKGDRSVQERDDAVQEIPVIERPPSVSEEGESDHPALDDPLFTTNSVVRFCVEKAPDLVVQGLEKITDFFEKTVAASLCSAADMVSPVKDEIRESLAGESSPLRSALGEDTAQFVGNALDKTLDAIPSALEGIAEPVKALAENFRKQIIEKAKPIDAIKSDPSSVFFLPRELFLIPAALLRSVEKKQELGVEDVDMAEKIKAQVVRFVIMPGMEVLTRWFHEWFGSSDPVNPARGGDEGEEVSGREEIGNNQNNNSISGGGRQLGSEQVEEEKEQDNGRLSGMPSSSIPPTGEEMELILRNAGFNVNTFRNSLPSVVKGKFPSTPEQWDYIASFFEDPVCWKDFKRVLASDRRRRAQPPTVATLQDKNSKWHKAISIFLGNPSVKLLWQARAMASTMGYGYVVGMWTASQTKYGELRANRPDSVRNIRKLSRELKRLDDMRRGQAVYEVTMNVKKNGESGFRDILPQENGAVIHIVGATFGYTSQTRKKLLDVTDRIRLCLDPLERKVKLQGVGLEKVLIAQDKKHFDSGIGGYVRMLRPDIPYSLTVKYKVCPVWAASEYEKEKEKLLRVSGLLYKGVGDVPPSTYTWYKLNEWVQVEFIQRLGAFLEKQPWYRFPFSQYMSSYWSLLGKEVKVVSKKNGMLRAVTDPGFWISFVPGLIMQLGFSSLQMLAWPLLKGWGEDYETGNHQDGTKKGKSGDKNIKGRPEETLVLRIGEKDMKKILDAKVQESKGQTAQRIKQRFGGRMLRKNPKVRTENCEKSDTAALREVLNESRIIKAVQIAGTDIFQVTVPAFLPLTTILLKMANVFQKQTQILDFSGQKEIQVRVRVPDTKTGEGKLQQFKDRVGLLTNLAMRPALSCEENFTFKLPTGVVVMDYPYPRDGQPGSEVITTGRAEPMLDVSLSVKTAHLLEVLSICKEHKIEVAHIYDFFA